MACSQASSRRFDIDIGVQAGITPTSFEDVQLRTPTLYAIARVRGRVFLTVCAPYAE